MNKIYIFILRKKGINMSNQFEFYAPTRVIFGRDTEKRAGSLLREYGAQSVLLVYGGRSAEASGLLQTVRDSLEAEGISYAELGGVVPNPRLSKVYEGIRVGREQKTDFLVGIGGGSAIDTAKAIAYGLANPEHDVWDFYTKKANPSACLPVAAILTIAAAGSEMSDSSVITNEETGEKKGCNTNLSRCRFAIMNPALTLTLPDYQTCSGATDIMMHTMERYFTNKGNMQMTDVIAEGLIRTVMDNALILHKDPSDYEARAELMWASSLSHNGLTGCGNGGNDFMSHKIEHELGGMFDVTHGAGLAAVWGSWARCVYKNCLPRFVKFAKNVMGIDGEGKTDEQIAEEGIAAMENYFHSIGMPVNMRELGISPTDEQIEELTDRCLAACMGYTGAAKSLTREDFRSIYLSAR